MALSRLRYFLLGVVVTCLLGFAADRTELNIRSVCLMFGYSDVSRAEAMFRALVRFENGETGIEAGHQNKTRDQEIVGNPCLPAGAKNFGKAARAMNRYTWSFALQNEWYRKQWAKGFAKWYHGCNGVKDKEECERINTEYAETLLRIYQDELEKVEKRKKSGGYIPPIEETQGESCE